MREKNSEGERGEEGILKGGEGGGGRGRGGGGVREKKKNTDRLWACGAAATHLDHPGLRPPCPPLPFDTGVTGAKGWAAIRLRPSKP